MSQSGSDTLINLGADILRIRNVLPGELLATDFSFGSGNFTISADRTVQRGSPGNDTFTINSDRNFLYGIDGQDTFNGSTESSMLDGGAGTDNFNMTDSSFNLVLGGADAAGDQMFFSGICAEQRVLGRRRQRLDRRPGQQRIQQRARRRRRRRLPGVEWRRQHPGRRGGERHPAGQRRRRYSARRRRQRPAADARSGPSGGSTAATATIRSWSACQEAVTRTPCM